MFLSAEKLIERAESEKIIDGFERDSVKHGAYELSVGGQFYQTSEEGEVAVSLKRDEQFSIPPGQLAILITEESIKVPNNLVAFISIKAGIKFKGLLNVSGFHVDPGFEGKLKFSVYNAGSRHLVLKRGQKAFSIWFACLDQSTKNVYNGTHYKQSEISPMDVMNLQGDIASPSQLRKELSDLKHQLDWIKWVAGFVAILLFGMQVKSCGSNRPEAGKVEGEPPSSQVDEKPLLNKASKGEDQELPTRSP